MELTHKHLTSEPNVFLCQQNKQQIQEKLLKAEILEYLGYWENEVQLVNKTLEDTQQIEADHLTLDCLYRLGRVFGIVGLQVFYSVESQLVQTIERYQQIVESAKTEPRNCGQ